MKTFKSVVVVKRPCDELWSVMRDHLVELADQIADIEKIEQRERLTGSDGTIHIVNQWHVRQRVSALVQSFLRIRELGWIDRNSWKESTRICSWTIEPLFLTEHIECSGQTRFEPAMAGRGARVTLEGSFDLKPGLFVGAMSALETPIAGFVESIVTTVVPRNMRDVVEAAAAFQVSRQ